MLSAMEKKEADMEVGSVWEWSLSREVNGGLTRREWNILMKTEDDEGTSCVLTHRRERVPGKGAIWAKALK